MEFLEKQDIIDFIRNGSKITTDSDELINLVINKVRKKLRRHIKNKDMRFVVALDISCFLTNPSVN